MKLMRLLALGGVGYGAYRWLSQRPQTMRKVQDAVSDVGEAVRAGDINRAANVVTEAVSGIGQSIRSEQSSEQMQGQQDQQDQQAA